jgi:hypothetical protein
MAPPETAEPQESPEIASEKSAQRHARNSPRTVESFYFTRRAIGIPRLTFGQRFPERIQIDEPQLNLLASHSSAPLNSQLADRNTSLNPGGRGSIVPVNSLPKAPHREGAGGKPQVQ